MNNIFDIDDITSVGQFAACRCFLSVSSVFTENCFHFTISDMSYLIRVVVVWTVITHITYIILIPICLIYIRCDRTVIILIQYTYNVCKIIKTKIKKNLRFVHACLLRKHGKHWLTLEQRV